MEQFNFSPIGKTCNNLLPDGDGGFAECGHPAHAVWAWSPGHIDGHRCRCCLRGIWEDTAAKLAQTLADLAPGCDSEFQDSQVHDLTGSPQT